MQIIEFFHIVVKGVPGVFLLSEEKAFLIIFLLGL